jgi:spore germination cell wall hydrolase CwlJ-like protein
MSKVLIGIATASVVAILGVQQYQLATISEDVAEIKQAFIAQTTEKVSYSESDEACLAKNIYYEAGIESEHGKYAVAQVTLNRLKTGRWGDTICSVVYSKAQFSWTLKKKLEKPSGQAWADSQWIAHRVLGGERVAQLDKVQFYHANYINSPKWAASMDEVTRVGRHIFYKKT